MSRARTVAAIVGLAALVAYLYQPVMASLASQWSTEVLRLAGYPVLLQGIYIDLPTVRLEVAAACSGFRSLVSLGATALLVAFTFQTRWVNRALLLASVVPIAILANSVRVTSNILLGIYEGTYHQVAGWLVFVLSLAVLLTVGMFLNRWNAPRSLA